MHFTITYNKWYFQNQRGNAEFSISPPWGSVNYSSHIRNSGYTFCVNLKQFKELLKINFLEVFNPLLNNQKQGAKICFLISIKYNMPDRHYLEFELDNYKPTLTATFEGRTPPCDFSNFH